MGHRFLPDYLSFLARCLLNAIVNSLVTDPTLELEPPVATAALAGDKPAERALNVWLVDDHAELRKMFSEALDRRQGIWCKRTFGSGAQILATLDEERPPDVILLDINLGNESGLDLIRPIKKLAPKVRVMMFTQFRNVHYAAEAFRAGANGFLLKTYDLEDIARLIRQAYNNSDSAGLFRNQMSCVGAELVAEIPGAAVPKQSSLPGAVRKLLHVVRTRIAH